MTDSINLWKLQKDLHRTTGRGCDLWWADAKSAIRCEWEFRGRGHSFTVTQIGNYDAVLSRLTGEIRSTLQ